MVAWLRIVRACFCEAYSQDSLELFAPQLFCTSCTLLPAIANSAHGGDRSFHTWAARKVLQGLRSFGEAKGWRSTEGMGAAQGGAPLRPYLRRAASLPDL